MKYLRFINFGFLVFSGIMTLIMAVVALIYLLLMGEHPKLAYEWPGVRVITACFVLMSLTAWAAWDAYRRSWWWLGLCQLLLVASISALVYAVSE